MDGFRSGYVTILGRPNVGKSTLLNQVLGEKISIVSKRPQTTRNRVLGIYNDTGVQMIFLDTPGVHKGKDPLNKAMVEAALGTLGDASVVLVLVEGNKAPGPGDRYVAEKVTQTGKPVILGLNKMDLVRVEERERIIEAYSRLGNFEEVLPMSALNGNGMDTVIEALVSRLEEGPQFFPDDMITDRPERFLAAETIREKCYLLLGKEVPYGIAVMVDSWEEDSKLIRIDATIHVERKSLKGIVIGKQGAMLKQIGTDARIDIEKLLAAKVFLKLWVKVSEGWSKSPGKLKELGYTE